MDRRTAQNSLRALSSSPYEPAPAIRSVVVNVIMAAARMLGRQSQVTPHLFKGTDQDKVAWEYSHAAEFFKSIGDHAIMDILDGKDVLDVGCGWGGKMIYFAEHSGLRSIHGFDLPSVYNPEVSEKFAKEKNITSCHFGTGYAEHIPFDDKSFDLIIMEDVFEHVENPQQVLEDCHRVLRPRGTIIIKFPSFRSIFAHHLDRAISFPALHYLLPLRVWASGLNYLRLTRSGQYQFEPFDEIVDTPYRRSITRNLNGLDFMSFQAIVRQTHQFATATTRLIPHGGSAKKSLPQLIYRFLYQFELFSEPLSNFILFIGEKHAQE